MLESLTPANFATNYVDGLYPHRRMWINGRHVSIEKIVSEKEEPRSPFEETTFAFIRLWLSGENEFTLSTSGSTGKPKAMVVTRQQMVASTLATAKKIGLTPKMPALVCIDTRYIGGMMMLARSLTLGLPILALDPCANPLIKIPVDKCVQFTAFVPYQVNAILESKHPHLLNNLERVLIGGAPIHPNDVQRLQDFQCACYETYGMTETVSHIALKLLNTPNKQQYFEALDGVTLSIDDRQCLVIRAGHLPDPVVTNDIVELINAHQFVWLGRADNVINTGGVKVIPEALETSLHEIFLRRGIPNAFFIAARPDDKLGSRVILVIEGVQFSSDALKEALDDLRNEVPSYQLPKDIYSAPVFEYAGNNKVDRRKTLEKATFVTPFG